MNDVHAASPSLREEGAPSSLERFSGIGIRPKTSSFHPFGCPVYVLDSALVSGQSIPKWDDRARVGIYLGPSLRHSRSVALVLLLATGLISPQYHVVFDDHFQTVKTKRPGSLFYKNPNGKSIISELWKRLPMPRPSHLEKRTSCANGLP